MLTPAVQIDPDLKGGLEIILRAIRDLMTPEELDIALQSYRVVQAKHQYDYLLKISAVMHDARIFQLQAMLQAEKVGIYAAARIDANERLDMLIAKNRASMFERFQKAADLLDSNLQTLARLRDEELRSNMRTALNKLFYSMLQELMSASDNSIKAIQEHLNGMQ